MKPANDTLTTARAVTLPQDPTGKEMTGRLLQSLKAGSALLAGDPNVHVHAADIMPELLRVADWIEQRLGGGSLRTLANNSVRRGVTPCCQEKWTAWDFFSGPIFWNAVAGVVQCHYCGAQFHAEATRQANVRPYVQNSLRWQTSLNTAVVALVSGDKWVTLVESIRDSLYEWWDEKRQVGGARESALTHVDAALDHKTANDTAKGHLMEAIFWLGHDITTYRAQAGF